MAIELRDISLDDLALYESMFCDPVHMAELGGPQPKEKVSKILENQVNGVAKGSCWVYKIVSVESGDGVGTVCLWNGSYKEQDVVEIGWGVMPKYQGRGFGSLAVRELVRRARESGRWGPIHAFTSVTNAPSNSICRSSGFVFCEECDIDYDDRMLHCNHWVLDM